VAVVGQESSIVPPKPEALLERYGASMDALVAREMAAFEGQAKQAASAAQGTDPAPLNRLGVVYARFSRLNEAEKAFAGSAKIRPNAPAYINLGNVYLIKGDYGKALDAFKKASAASPRSVAALAGAALAAFELEDKAAAAAFLAELARIDEAAAGRYAYLSSDSGSRAASSSAANAVAWEE